MKRLICLLLATLLSIAGISWAAAPRLGSWTETTTEYTGGLRESHFVWAADSTGAVEVKTTTRFFRGFLMQCWTKPDTTLVPATADSIGRKPSDDYDITLTTRYGSMDFWRSQLLNRDETNSEFVIPMTPDSLAFQPVVNDKLVITITDNLIPNARGHIYILWQEK